MRIAMRINKLLFSVMRVGLGLLGFLVMNDLAAGQEFRGLPFDSGNPFWDGKAERVRMEKVTDIAGLNAYIDVFMNVNHIPGLAACLLYLLDILERDSYFLGQCPADIIPGRNWILDKCR